MKKPRNRTERIFVTFSPEEKAALESFAEKQGMAMAPWIRHISLKYSGYL